MSASLSGPGYSPKGGAAKASPAEPSIPSAEPQFVAGMNAALDRLQRLRTEHLRLTLEAMMEGEPVKAPTLRQRISWRWWEFRMSVGDALRRLADRIEQ